MTSLKILAFLFLMVPHVLFSQESNEQEENTHRDPTHNFTMLRLIIINDKNEMLMSKEDYVWAPPAGMYSNRQYLNESLDSIANSYGVKICNPQLRGFFSYKYDYHAFSTLRAYYVAHYISGDLKVPKGYDKTEWVPVQQAIEMNTVTSIKQSIQQIIDFPNQLWGGSFMVSRDNTGHPTKQVEPFYSMFEIQKKD